MCCYIFVDQPSSFHYIVPRIQTVNTGDNATFKCYSDNVATWYFMDENGSENSFSMLSSTYSRPKLNVTSLYILNATIQNEGLYLCDISRRGKIYFREALLKINGEFI